MEEIYANDEYDKPVQSRSSTNQTGPIKSERRCHGSVVLCLGLLSVFLLAGLIGVRVHYHNSARDATAELSTIQANLTQLLQVSNNKVSSLTDERDQLNRRLSSLTTERDQLNSKLIKTTEERDRLRQCVETTCPAGWKMFSCSCYFLSSQSGSWTKGRDDCRNRGADLVIIDSDKEQTFIFGFAMEQTWIGLNDRDEEGTWKWVDGTPLTFTYWAAGEPNNGNKQHGEEDCVQITQYRGSGWNDLSCEASLRWICEKSLGLDVQKRK